MKFKELLGEYNDLGRALKEPNRVKKLNVSLDLQEDFYSVDFAQFINLRELYIHMWIDAEDSLLHTIGSLTKLKKLLLLNVSFKEFPEWIFNLVNLEYLMVRGNNLNYVPNGISALKKLHTLRIENCELKFLPHDLFMLDSLKELSVVHTPVAIFPDMLPKNIRELRILRQEEDREELRKELFDFPKLIVK
ncbi:hypothetical protein GN157_08475 [Flavobacterium rakeshii]|uniref:Disease resistance R13L4/SHOC-2-like LRR domain-containing protein n=1 Tax=Flavobacterium rakeshii TaxID=1038845 RepID=A0A6N8HC05_9FLAO|nr:hypothetical protein [Flavobacterium rakeshii]MEE1896724.1 hypothetical protein [Flavobacterium rakeshii]MUV03742.1 hypothetical protein [Flavobacterium rakeshii]